jgi:hypothetical protein
MVVGPSPPDRPETCQRPASCGVLEQSVRWPVYTIQAPCGRRSSAASPPAACGTKATPALVHMMVTCETWRNSHEPRCYSGAEGPHFSLALSGPSNPTRAVTSPAWKLPPRSEMVSCRRSSPKSRSRLRPHSPRLKQPGPPGMRDHVRAAAHLDGADHRLPSRGRLAVPVLMADWVSIPIARRS